MSTSEPATPSSSSDPLPTANASDPSPPNPAPKTCAKCGKPESAVNEEDVPILKPCSMCKSVDYCSRDCKKADTKVHKKVCAGLAQAYAQTRTEKPAVRAPPKGGDRSGGLRKWQFDT